MATGFASVLSEGQLAQLDLGEEVVRCTVVGFTGADVILEMAEQPEERPALDSTTFLLLEAGGRLHALKTIVRPGSTDSEVIVTLVDSFRLGQRRLFSRAPLVLPAHLRPTGDAGKPWTTFTRDISAGGLRVARQSSYRPADEQEVVIGLVQVQREIRARANVVRETDADLSLSFTHIEPEDRLLLAQLTFAYHRRGAVG
jgi:PilZ domain